MKEIKNKDYGNLVKTLVYPEGCDNIDKAIIDIINNSQKSMSIFTLKNKLLKQAFNFDERLERLTKIVKGLKMWEQIKPTPQIGTEVQQKDSQEDIEEE